MEDKRIIELLEDIKFYAAYIDRTVFNTIEETEDLLKHILAGLKR